jgi:ribonuclease P protein component
MDSTSPGRVGIVVAKTVARHAVDRNLLKRRIRSIMSRRRIPAGYNLVFITHPPAKSTTYAILNNVIAKLMAQASDNLNRPRRN